MKKVDSNKERMKREMNKNTLRARAMKQLPYTGRRRQQSVIEVRNIGPPVPAGGRFF